MSQLCLLCVREEGRGEEGGLYLWNSGQGADLHILQGRGVLSECAAGMPCGDPDFCVESILLGWGHHWAVGPSLSPWRPACCGVSVLLLILPKEVVSLCPPGARGLGRGSPGSCFLESGIVEWKKSMSLRARTPGFHFGLCLQLLQIGSGLFSGPWFPAWERHLAGERALWFPHHSDG